MVIGVKYLKNHMYQLIIGGDPMKNLSLLFILTFCVLSIISCSQESNPFVGSWELVSYKNIWPDTTITGDTSTLQSIKVLSPTHFALATVNPIDSSFVHGGAGSYSYNENQYIEKIEYQTYKIMIGKSYDFTYKFEGDTWTIDGDLEEFNLRIVEVWRRLK
jgi:hypothetical protein